MDWQFLKYKKFYYFLSAVLAGISLASVFAFSLNFGIDFIGGSLLEISFERRPENAVIQEKLQLLGLGEVILQPIAEKEAVLRLKEINEETKQQIVSKLNEISPVQEQSFETVGPIIGKELRQKTIILIFFSLLALLIYIAVSFRKVSRPLAGWQFGLISIFALGFDVLLPVGVLAFLGRFYNTQFNIPIITALLTILGYTINDKVVVFDRVREGLFRSHHQDFKSLVNQSLNQVFFRSISTGTCTLLVLLAIFFLGGETLKYFALTLIVGIAAGTYSSLFLATPLLVSWFYWREKRSPRF